MHFLSFRLSSLDMYLLQPKEEPTLYVLKGKEKLHDVIEEVRITKPEICKRGAH